MSASQMGVVEAPHQYRNTGRTEDVGDLPLETVVHVYKPLAALTRCPGLQLWVTHVVANDAAGVTLL